MDHLSTSDDGKIVFCGKRFAHIFETRYKDSERSPSPLRSQHSVPKNLTSLDMNLYLPETCKIPHERVSIVCCELSKDGSFLCVADSEKNMYLFDRPNSIWDLYSNFETEKRILTVKFDRSREHLIMTDKNGDVYISVLSSPDQSKKCVKILGHCSLILDTVLSANNKYIYTSDRDEKIRCSRFPDAHQIEYFLLGHKTAVVNIALLHEDHNLLSISVDGEIKLWTVADHRCIKTWNVFTVCHGNKYVKPAEHEVKRMKVTSIYDTVHLAVVISGMKEIPVFDLKLHDQQIRQVGQVKMESEHCDMEWYGNSLFTYNPEQPVVVRRFNVTSEGVLCDTSFGVPKMADYHHDFKDLVKYYQTSVPLRKRASGESIKAEDLQTRMDEYKAETEKKIPRIVRGSRSSSGSRLVTAVTEEKQEGEKLSEPMDQSSPSTSTPSKPKVTDSDPEPEPPKAD